MKDSKSEELVIAGIGEVLWDVLEETEELGGAPVNFAYHAGALGAESYAISCVGDDRRGVDALAELSKRNVSTAYIHVLPGATTGFVQAKVDDQGVATYEFPDDVAWDNLVITEQAGELADRLHAICFGSLAQRSMKSRVAIQDYLKKLDPKTLKVFDLNIRQEFYTPDIIKTSLEMADVLKLNDDEIDLLGDLFAIKGDHESVLKQLIDRFALQLGVLTRGGHGSLLVSTNATSSHEGYPANIADTIGAGDSFTAVTALGLLKGFSLEQINDHANRVAAYVCSHQGAMPILPEELMLK